jgi:hypothetical protein
MMQKKNLDSVPHPDPGRNTKRKFADTMHDINKSPCNFEKTSSRVPHHEQVPRIDGPHDKRFEPFSYFP